MNNNHANKVTALPTKLLAVALIMTGVVLVSLVGFTFVSYRNATTAQRHNLRIKELRGDIMHLDETLILSARMAAATGNLNWERRYRGFTTKKDGHGFGLYSSALAAREMGGSLTLHSDGPGRGAAFTLELPCGKNRP